MPRRREIPKRYIAADPLYDSPLVTKFINCVMTGGKRSTAERILYKSFDIIKEKAGDDPLKIFKKAIENELLDAANLRGGAVKKREDTHRMAEANKAFAHYRW